MSPIQKPFVGNFPRRIDGKDRIVIPSKWVPRITNESEGTLYLVPSATLPCVEAYPAQEYLAIAEGQRPDPFGGAQDDRRAFYQLAVEVDIKGPGRIGLPREWVEERFADGEVTVAGMKDYLEIWNTAAWQARVQNRARLPGTGGSGTTPR